MIPRFTTLSTPLFGLLILAIALPSTGCDPVGPPRIPVSDTTRLFSLARAEYQGEQSGFDFAQRRAVVIEDPRSAEEFDDFDIAFSELDDGTFVIIPAGVFEGLATTPGIAVDSSSTFEGMERAPDDFISDEPVVVSTDVVYVIQSRNHRGCRFYAKVQVLELDAEGILDFRYLASNLCNDRVLTDEED